MNLIKHKIAAIMCLGTGCTTMTIVTDIPTLIKKIWTPKQNIQKFVETINNISEIQEQIKTQTNQIYIHQQSIDKTFKEKQETEQQIAEYEKTIPAQKQQAITLKSNLQTVISDLAYLQTTLTNSQAEKATQNKTIQTINEKIIENTKITKTLNDSIRNLRDKKDKLQKAMTVPETTTITKTRTDYTVLDQNIEIIQDMIKETTQLHTEVLNPASAELTQILSEINTKDGARKEYREKLTEHANQLKIYQEKSTELQNIYKSLTSDLNISVEEQIKIMGNSKHIKEQLVKLNKEIKEKAEILKKTRNEKNTMSESFRNLKEQLATTVQIEAQTKQKLEAQKQNQQQINVELQINQQSLIQNQKDFWITTQKNTEARKNLNQQMFQKSQKITQITSNQNKLD